MESDLNDVRYLYYFGEYITDSELRTAKKLNAMSEAEISKMAEMYHMEVEKIKEIIRSERLRVTRVMPDYLEMLGDSNK